MVNLTINDKKISVKEGTTIMEAAKANHIHIPHLCYLKEINEVAACRLCCVEVEGSNKLIPACDNVVSEGMVIKTNTKRVVKSVRNNLATILSRHNGECIYCERSENCQLQNLANAYNVGMERFKYKPANPRFTEWNKNFPLIKDQTRCVNCLRCINVCDKIQNMNVWDLLFTGDNAHVGVRDSKKIEEVNCALCGQCITHCPVGALKGRDDIDDVAQMIFNPNIITVFQFAPAVRSAWLESFNLDKEELEKIDVEKRLVGMIRTLGADYVFDTSFAADLTIMEEANEFIERFSKNEFEKIPMFTSCCPGWLRFVKSEYPLLLKYLSTAKSPHEMGGAVVKSYFAKKLNLDPAKIKVISIMPCIAKKDEAKLENLKNDDLYNVDYVLTVRELISLIKSRRLSPKRVEDSDYDSIIGDFTGAGVIFGTSGGVLEAALRTAYWKLTGKTPDIEIFNGLHVVDDRGGLREATLKINDITLRVATVSGLGNTRELINDILKERKHYDFVEVMACPTGCAGGGGQPIHLDDVERGRERGKMLLEIDKDKKVRFSHENEDVKTLYKEFFEKPLSEKSEEYLHTHHTI